LKPEQQASPVVQEKYQEEKACDKRQQQQQHKQNIMQYIYHKQKETANADYVNNMTRHENTLHQHTP
jgi:membrane carboxypeptidase/penicillin-binding protein